MALQKEYTFGNRDINMRVLIYSAEQRERGTGQYVPRRLIGILCEPVSIVVDSMTARWDIDANPGGVQIEFDADEYDRHRNFWDPMPSRDDWDRDLFADFDIDQWMARAMDMSVEDWKKLETLEGRKRLKHQLKSTRRRLKQIKKELAEYPTTEEESEEASE